MAKNVEVGIIHGAQNAFCLLLLVHGETRVDGAYGVVELAKDLVGVVERAVGEDVHLSRFEKVDAGELLVELVDRANLIFESPDGETVSDLQAWRVVADADVCIAVALPRERHLL